MILDILRRDIHLESSAIIDIIHSGDSLAVKSDVKLPVQGTCERCDYISSQKLCKACILLEGLNRGLPRLGVGKTMARNMQDRIRKLQIWYGVAEEQPNKEGEKGCSCCSIDDGGCGTTVTAEATEHVEHIISLRKEVELDF